MRWTNKLGLPTPIVRAVMNDPYDRGQSDFTVTQLIGPARARALRKRYRDEIEEDVADRIYSLMGQSIHTILERAETEYMAEERYYTEIDGQIVSGQFDRCVILPKEGLLQDYKMTSVWSELGKDDWIQQLNMLVFILARNNIFITRAEIAAVFRDWSKSRARRETDYPQHQVVVVPVEIWPEYRTLEFIRGRIKAHLDAEIELPLCTDKERWYKDEQWAVMKENNKRATSLHSTKLEAETVAQKMRDDAAKLVKQVKVHVEVRPGTPVRCMDYCTSADFCTQFRG